MGCMALECLSGPSHGLGGAAMKPLGHHSPRSCFCLLAGCKKAPLGAQTLGMGIQRASLHSPVGLGRQNWSYPSQPWSSTRGVQDRRTPGMQAQHWAGFLLEETRIPSVGGENPSQDPHSLSGSPVWAMESQHHLGRKSPSIAPLGRCRGQDPASGPAASAGFGLARTEAAPDELSLVLSPWLRGMGAAGAGQ